MVCKLCLWPAGHEEGCPASVCNQCESLKAEIKNLKQTLEDWDTNEKRSKRHIAMFNDNIRFRDALMLIAAPQRPDGTWNRERAACQKLALDALNNSSDG